jgi:hypothetical protein
MLPSVELEGAEPVEQKVVSTLVVLPVVDEELIAPEEELEEPEVMGGELEPETVELAADKTSYAPMPATPIITTATTAITAGATTLLL